MLRKISIVCLFLVIISSTLGGASCISTPGNQAPKEQITLTMWGLFDDKEVFDPIISDYQSNHPNIKINYIKKDYDEYELKTSEALASGEGPDIWEIENDWMARDYKKIVPMPDGLLAKTMQGKSDLDVYKEKFAPIASEDNIIDNKIYGMPLSIDTLALYYNTDIFNAKSQELYIANKNDEARLFENPPADWDKFITLSKMLTVKNQQDVSRAGASLGTSKNIDKANDILFALMMQNNTPMVAADKQSATFNLSSAKSSGGIVYPGTNALDFYTGFSNSGKEVYTWNNSMPESVQAFMNGQSAMMIHYSYIQKRLAQEKPTLNYSIGPLPQIKGVTTPVDFSTYWVETVTKNSKHSSEAWDFIIYMATQKAQSYDAATKRPSPYRIDQSALPKNIDQRVELKGDLFDFQKMTAHNWYKGTRPDKVNTIFSSLINNVVEFGQPAQSAIDSAAAQVTSLLKETTPPNFTVTESEAQSTQPKTGQ